jgi:membrane-anchored glycerophosphoryl diester phosphodiesterase (GDPDase)
MLGLQAFHYEPELSLAIYGRFLLSAIWLCLLLYAINKFGKRSLWLFIGAPPVFFALYLLFGIPIACAVFGNCL